MHIDRRKGLLNTSLLGHLGLDAPQLPRELVLFDLVPLPLALERQPVVEIILASRLMD